MTDVRELLNKAHLALENGQTSEAATFYGRAAAQAPGNVAIGNNLGVILEQLGRFDEALAVYDKVILLDSTRADIHANRANVLRALGRDDEAVPSWRLALALNRDHAQAAHNLGVCLRERGERTEAESLLRLAASLVPQSVDAQVNLGALLQEKGDQDEALECYRRAPGSPEAAAGEATILEQRGDFESSCAVIIPAFEREPGNVDVAVAFASVARKLRRSDEAISALRGISIASRTKRQAVLFALGKLLDAEGNYTEAFDAYEQANRLSANRFDRASFTNIASQIRDRYSPERFATAKCSSNESEVPVFVVGMPRSGTTLVEQIIASHPDAAGAGELPFIERLATGSKSLDEAASEYLSHLAGFERSRVVDKMPGNFLHLGYIALLFPRARIIHISRDPSDTCLSCYFQHFKDGHAYSHSLDDLGFVYREYENTIAHWRTLPLRMMEIRYEDIVADQERETRRLLEFCGLSWDERCMRFHETKRFVRTASYDQVRQPLYAQSVGRHRVYAEFLAPLRAALG
jgi:tetratricopeptide (TPR) repeat protein